MFKPASLTAPSTLATLAALLGASFCAAAAAELYTIQIGAFKHPSAQYTEPAQAVGAIYATERDNGVIALSVGRFDSSDSASAALEQIRDAYPSAYVRRAHGNARQQFGSSTTAGSSRPAFAASGSVKATPTAPATQSDADSLLASLSAKERKHVVYLDGELHFKQGEQFVPLAEYRARNP